MMSQVSQASQQYLTHVVCVYLNKLRDLRRKKRPTKEQAAAEGA